MNAKKAKVKYGKKVVLCTLVLMNFVRDQPAPEVLIEQGILVGKVSETGAFYEYLGIPYATTNSSLRFKAPLPPPSWTGVYKATEEMYQCPQPSILWGVMGTEDCLKINVYVPAKEKKPFPVMIYIHGGTYMYGNGGKILYGPDFLVKQDVIVVTFNYRLGALGFLCLGIKEAPGNAGLKDQIAAIKWVKKNIAAFGGDPNAITIFGLSSGATSVSILLASDAATGLFNRAIVQSGVSTSSWAINRQPLFTASVLAKALGYNTEDPIEIYNILSKLPYKKLIEVNPVKPIGKYFDFQLINYPCIEKRIEGEEAVLTDLPYNIFQNKPTNISVIYGTSSKEGLLILANDTEQSLKDRNSRYIFPPDLQFSSDEEAANLSSIVKKIYFDDKDISFKMQYPLSELYTHMYFEVPSILESEMLASISSGKIYNYYFNYSGQRNFLKIYAGYWNETGAVHADELMYLFNGLAWQFPINEKDQQMIDWMTKMWTDFAKYGDPTPSSSDIPTKWSPISKNNISFLYIGDELKMGPIPNPEAYTLWKDIYSKYRKLDQLNDFKS